MSENKTNKEAISAGAMYQNLVGRLKALVLEPRKEWRKIFAENSTNNEVLSHFNIPLIGLYTLAVFIGYLVSHQGLDFERALKNSIFTFASCFFSLFVAYFILQKTLRLFGQVFEKQHVFKLIAVSSVTIYIVGTIVALFPETYFVINLFNLYVFYLVWLAFPELKELKKEAHVWLTLLVGCVILLLPVLIEYLFSFISKISL